jgi:hypothetical protein
MNSPLLKKNLIRYAYAFELMINVQVSIKGVITCLLPIEHLITLCRKELNGDASGLNGQGSFLKGDG